MTFETDLALGRWCRRHHGIVAIADLPFLGVAQRDLERRAAAGVLERVHTGVYRHRSHPVTFASELRAASASLPDAYVSGHSLMRLFDVRGEWSARPELTLVGPARSGLAGVRLRRIDSLDVRDLRRRLGFPILAPELGLLLLGATTHPRRVEAAVHDMVFQGITTRHRLVATLGRYAARGRRGTTAFRQAVRSLDVDGRATQTNLELRLLRAVREAGLPEPELQLRVHDGDGRERRLDLAWTEYRLDVETDGDRWHLNPTDRSEMAIRDASLAAVGWTTERFDSARLDDDVEGAVRRLAELLARSPFSGTRAPSEGARVPKNEVRRPGS